jgi:hypothetical protein
MGLALPGRMEPVGAGGKWPYRRQVQHVGGGGKVRHGGPPRRIYRWRPLIAFAGGKVAEFFLPCLHSAQKIRLER